MFWNVTDSPQQSFWVKSKVYAPNLVCDDREVVTRTVTLTGAVYLKRGSVLGQMIDGRYALASGSDDPSAVLALDSDPSAGDVQATVFLSARVNGQDLIFGDGMTLDFATPLLRRYGIYVSGDLT